MGLLDRWAQLHTLEMIAHLEISAEPPNVAGFQRVLNVYLVCLPPDVRDRRDMVLLETGYSLRFCWKRAIPSGSAGLTKVLLMWWEAGNRVTAPYVGSAEYLGNMERQGRWNGEQNCLVIETAVHGIQSWWSLQWATFMGVVYIGSSSWVHRNFIQLVALGFIPAGLSLQISRRCYVYPKTFVLTSAFCSGTKKLCLLWNPYFQGLKSMFRRRQTSLIFCRAEESFILNTILASCFLVAPIQEHSCCKHSASIFCAKFCIRVKINGNSSGLMWQLSSEANWEEFVNP